MGSASSKAARAYPVKPGKSPSWGGARMPAYDPKTSPSQNTSQPLASESKDEGKRRAYIRSSSGQCSNYVPPLAILRDARDPQLHANLNKLGPVRVDHHMQTVRTVRSVAFCVLHSRLTGFFFFWVSHKQASTLQGALPISCARGGPGGQHAHPA